MKRISENLYSIRVTEFHILSTALLFFNFALFCIFFNLPFYSLSFRTKKAQVNLKFKSRIAPIGQSLASFAFQEIFNFLPGGQEGNHFLPLLGEKGRLITGSFTQKWLSHFFLSHFLPLPNQNICEIQMFIMSRDFPDWFQAFIRFEKILKNILFFFFFTFYVPQDHIHLRERLRYSHWNAR